MALSSIRTSADRVFDFTCMWILPFGFLLLLAGPFFLPERSLHHKLFYLLFSAPALVVMCLHPREIGKVLREPIVRCFLLFAAYACLTLLWSPTDSDAGGLIKRPLHTLMLFVGTAVFVRHRSEALMPLLLVAATLVLGATVREIHTFWQYGVDHPELQQLRLSGSGAMDNSLLTSHLLGFFATFWMFRCLNSHSLKPFVAQFAAFALMLAAVIMTRSRMPLAALAAAFGWMMLLRFGRRAFPILLASTLLFVALFFLAPQLVIGRGDSYRFEIWEMTWRLIVEHPLFGHGYDAPLAIDPGSGIVLSEPHSFTLGVIYNLGFLGLLPWLAMLGFGLYSGIKHRHQPLFVMASTLLVFGIGAGLTEGGGIMSRPKEHWFLLWIPLALLIALNIARRTGQLLSIQSRRLSAEQAAEMAANARVIEEDGLGPKVLELADGNFLKLFRKRRWYTSGSVNPYAERFARNSQQLAALGFVTPEVLNLYGYPDGSQGVQYRPLPGRTLRQALEQAGSVQERQRLCQRLGRFVAQMHEQGVYFRSLHLGNVLLLDDDSFGLIDLADLRILPSPLSRTLRQRNLRHMQRYTEDRRWLFEENVEALLNGYADVASARNTQLIRQRLQPTE